MSIFFYHVALSVFLAAFFLSYFNKPLKTIFLPALFGALFGFACFGAFAISADTDGAKIFFDALAIGILIASPLIFKFENYYLNAGAAFLLATSYGFDYRFISANFGIFAGELLDSLSLANLFMTLLGFAVCACAYFLARALAAKLSRALRAAFLAICLIVLVFDRAGFLGLSLMQEGLVPTYSNLLSLVAKLVYANGFLPIFFSCLLVFFAIFALAKTPSAVGREDIIKFRLVKAARIGARRDFGFALALALITSGLSLYYINIESKPPVLSPATIVEPVNGEFKFDANIVRDNELHRFAYITDDGHKIRFFLLNRFPDKLAPVAVYDSCAICGDMGYVKKGENLICISCNVRIFLPSVGKPGGCNPIPFDYKFDGQNITISLEELEKGATFFGEVVQKEVTDPVSRKKIMNTSKFSYLYYNRTYFFENEKNQAEFEANPEKYVTTKGVLKELK